MKQITANSRPAAMSQHRKKTTVFLQWVDEAFTVQTMEGTTHMVDEGNEHWEDGYWVAWPDDGTDPYPIAPSFVRDNYEPVEPNEDS